MNSLVGCQMSSWIFVFSPLLWYTAQINTSSLFPSIIRVCIGHSVGGAGADGVLVIVGVGGGGSVCLRLCDGRVVRICLRYCYVCTGRPNVRD